MTPFQAWALALLLWLSPPEHRARLQEARGRAVPVEQRETVAEGRARYATIAEDLDAVLEDPSTWVSSGARAKERTAAMVLAVAFFESGFRKDVDRGEGRLGRGDKGRSWCLMQIQTGTGGGTVPVGDTVARTWTGPDLVADRRKCLRAGALMIKASFQACRAQKTGDRLSAYTTGACRDDEPVSRMRVAKAAEILRHFPLPALPSPPAEPTASAAVPAGHAAP